MKTNNVLNDLSFKSLVGMYAMTVVFLVRRQLTMVVEKEVVTVVMTDETIIKDVDSVDRKDFIVSKFQSKSKYTVPIKNQYFTYH